MLLKRLIADGAPITTVGIQGHWSVPGMSSQKLEDIDRAIEDYKALKLKVAITELDLTIAGAGGGQLGGGGRGRGAATPASPESLQAQADAYAKLFAIFLKHRDVVNRVTFWDSTIAGRGALGKTRWHSTARTRPNPRYRQSYPPQRAN